MPMTIADRSAKIFPSESCSCSVEFRADVLQCPAIAIDQQQLLLPSASRSQEQISVSGSEKFQNSGRSFNVEVLNSLKPQIPRYGTLPSIRIRTDNRAERRTKSSELLRKPRDTRADEESRSLGRWRARAGSRWNDSGADPPSEATGPSNVSLQLANQLS